MRLKLTLATAATCTLLAGCYWGPYPYGPYYSHGYGTTTVTSPASFDKSWDAALGAATDAQVAITRVDREAGRIIGTKGGATVIIDVKPQADKTLHVIFTAPDSTETNPTLGQRWQAAYNRRMGR